MRLRGRVVWLGARRASSQPLVQLLFWPNVKPEPGEVCRGSSVVETGAEGHGLLVR